MSAMELSSLQYSYLLPAAAANDPLLPAELAHIRQTASASGVEHAQQQNHLRQQQEAHDHELAMKMQQNLNSGVLEARTRTRRASLSAWLRHSFADGEIQLLLFPLVDACGQSALKKKQTNNVNSSSSTRIAPGVITPTTQTLADMRALFKSTFSNVTDQTLTGHAAVVLLDEGDFRLKRANSSNRAMVADAAASAPHPFDTLACAGIFDVVPYMFHGESVLVMKISYFAAAEQLAGQGFAKLLLTHLKVHATLLAKQTGKDVKIVLLSLKHTIPFWTSPSMGMMAKGDIARILSALNYCDTELLSLEVTAQHAAFFEAERAKCIACVRERRSLPPEALRKFPRFQQQEVQQVKLKRKSGGSASSSGRRNNAGAAASSQQSQDESEEESESDADSSRGEDDVDMIGRSRAPSLTQSTASSGSDSDSSSSDDSDADKRVETIFGAPICPPPSRATMRELAAFQQLVLLAFRRPHALPLQGNPPPQLTHTRVEQFAVGELVVAAVQEGRGQRLTRLSDGRGAHFTLEQAVVVRLFAGAGTRGSESVSCAIVRLIQRQPSAGCGSVRCLIALCFLFKKNAKAA